jgi:hypothetical protein
MNQYAPSAPPMSQSILPAAISGPIAAVTSLPGKAYAMAQSYPRAAMALVALLVLAIFYHMYYKKSPTVGGAASAAAAVNAAMPSSAAEQKKEIESLVAGIKGKQAK